MLFFVKAIASEVKWELTIQAVKAHLEDLQQLKKQGKLVFHGAILGKKGGIEILNLESVDELAQILNPMMPFFEIEVTPLIDYEGTLQLVQQIQSRVPEKITAES